MAFTPKPLPSKEIIVAASDSTARSRANAAYRCTGANDEVQINQAIQAAGANGKVILDRNGSYSIAATITLDQAGQTLIGGNITESSVLQNMIEVTANDVIIDSCILNGAEDSGSFSAFLFRAGILLSTVNNVNVSGCTVSDKGLGIYASQSDTFRIVNNSIYGYGADLSTLQNLHVGVYITGGADNGLVMGSFINGMGAGITAGSTSQNLRIIGNRVDTYWDNGTYMSSGEGCTIQGNTYQNGRGVTSSGVKVRGSFHNVAGNTIRDVGVGIVCSPLQIVSNNRAAVDFEHRALHYNSGSEKPANREVVTGATTGATGSVTRVTRSAGRWADGDAEGIVFIEPTNLSPRHDFVISSGDLAADLITDADHTLNDGDAIEFINLDPATSSDLNAMGIDEGTTYYVRDSTATQFKVEASIGGGAVDLVEDGDGRYFRKLLVNTSTDTCTLATHGFINGDYIAFTSSPSRDPYTQTVQGTTADSLPGGILRSNNYYVRNITANTFQVSLYSDGSITDLTSAGAGIVEVRKVFMETENVNNTTSGTSNVFTYNNRLRFYGVGNNLSDNSIENATTTGISCDNLADAVQSGTGITVGTDDIFLESSHSLGDFQIVNFTNITGVVGISTGVDYYVRDSIANVSFKVSATPGGAAVDITTGGTCDWDHPRKYYNNLNSTIDGNTISQSSFVTNQQTYGIRFQGINMQCANNMIVGMDRESYAGITCNTVGTEWHAGIRIAGNTIEALHALYGIAVQSLADVAVLDNKVMCNNQAYFGIGECNDLKMSRNVLHGWVDIPHLNFEFTDNRLNGFLRVLPDTNVFDEYVRVSRNVIISEDTGIDIRPVGNVEVVAIEGNVVTSLNSSINLSPSADDAADRVIRLLNLEGNYCRSEGGAGENIFTVNISENGTTYLKPDSSTWNGGVYENDTYHVIYFAIATDSGRVVMNGTSFQPLEDTASTSNAFDINSGPEIVATGVSFGHPTKEGRYAVFNNTGPVTLTNCAFRNLSNTQCTFSANVTDVNIIRPTVVGGNTPSFTAFDIGSATGSLFFGTKSTGTTGGAASAGAGNQYVELEVNGTVYKVLHDGTV